MCLIFISDTMRCKAYVWCLAMGVTFRCLLNNFLLSAARFYSGQKHPPNIPNSHMHLGIHSCSTQWSAFEKSTWFPGKKELGVYAFPCCHSPFLPREEKAIVASANLGWKSWSRCPQNSALTLMSLICWQGQQLIPFSWLNPTYLSK